VVCAANRFEGIKLHDQHLAERLARLRPVLYVDPPASLLTAWRNPDISVSLESSRLRVEQPGLARFTPVVLPFPSRRWMAGVTTTLTRRLLRNATIQLGGRVAAVISGWPMHPVLGSCGERVRVYWAQDDFVGGAALLRLDADKLLSGEMRSAAAADVIIAANPVVADTWRQRGYSPQLIPFGVDAKAYEAVDERARPADVDLPSPIVGFVGHINERIDLPLLEATAATGRSLLLVGPRTAPLHDADRWARLLALPNVRWVGPKRFEDLPGYYRVIDVGLVPYGDSPFNRGSFPLKTLEYLAAGRPVVATGLPAVRWLQTDLVSIEDEPAAFAAAVDKWLREPRTPAAVAARRAFAAKHDWDERARDVVAAIDHIAGSNTRH
jgi:glycosyltransferase involved in cell wall biosynthesis